MKGYVSFQLSDSCGCGIRIIHVKNNGESIASQEMSPYLNIAIAYGVLVFDNEPLEAGVTQLYERRRLECKCVIPAESASLSNTITTNVLTFIVHAEFICVTYMLF